MDNLIAVIDDNGQQIDGPVDQVMPLGDLHAKWQAFGWTVLAMDGNNVEDVLNTLQKAKDMCGHGKPVCILMKTAMGKGVSFMEGTHKWHGSPPNNEQLAKALAEIEETLGDY